MTEELSQADREAAIDVAKRLDIDDWATGGGYFAQTLRQAFARHRTQARQAALEEGREQWDGLARQIMMAFDCEAKTPRKLLQHLERCGETIPAWLRDEPEMANLDHVMSKGTRCVLIYRAMTEHLLRTLSTPEPTKGE